MRLYVIDIEGTRLLILSVAYTPFAALPPGCNGNPHVFGTGSAGYPDSFELKN
jgi:hypothetical protein